MMKIVDSLLTICVWDEEDDVDFDEFIRLDRCWYMFSGCFSNVICTSPIK